MEGCAAAMRPLLLALSVCTLGLTLAVQGRSGDASFPAWHDDFANAKSISVPISTSALTGKATLALNDPPLSCSFTYGYSVWYRYTPPADQTLRIDTLLSHYDTVLAVFTGAKGSLTEVACNDDFVDLDSQVEVAVSGGVTYHIMVGAAGSAPIGTLELLRFRVNHQVPAPDMAGFVGTYTSVALGTDGLPIVSYNDSSNADMKVAHCGNADCSAGNQLTAVDANSYGEYTSLAIGTDGLPIVSYYNPGPGDLKVAHCGNVQCTAGNTSFAVDTAGDVGQWTSLAIGTDGLPIVSHWDVGNMDLKVTHCGNADCTSGNTSTIVDGTGSDVGSHTSLAIGLDGLPLISYYDLGGGNLKVAHCGNVTCSSGNTITKVDSAGTVGAFTSLILGADLLPFISYFDLTNFDLKVAHCGNALCSSGNTLTTIDGVGNVGQWTSATVGPEGYPLISYYDASDTALRLARCGNALCSSGNVITTPAYLGDVGRHTSIAMGADGRAVVSHYDTTSADLRFVRAPSGPFSTLLPVPVKWCGVAGTPSIDDPSLVGQLTASEVMNRRHQRVNDSIYIPQIDLSFRSGTTGTMPSHPIISDPIVQSGELVGDVTSVTELMMLQNSCRAAWLAATGRVGGVTAVHTRRFMPPVGAFGYGGSFAPFCGSAVLQVMYGRIWVNDAPYSYPSVDPPLVGHELGHALCLNHGDGANQDSDAKLDEDPPGDPDSNGTVDDDGDGSSDEDGPLPTDASCMPVNLMCYGQATGLTTDEGNCPTPPQIPASQRNVLRCQAEFSMLDTTPFGYCIRVMPAPWCRDFIGVSVDTLSDVPGAQGFIDLDSLAVAVDNVSRKTSLATSTFAPLPASASDLRYVFIVDVDDNSATGGTAAEASSALGIAATLNGGDLIGDVEVDVTAGVAQVSATVRRFQAGSYTLVTDPNIEADVTAEIVHGYPDPSGMPPTSPVFTLGNAVSISLPNAIRAPMAPPFAIEYIAYNPATGTTDRAVADMLQPAEQYPQCLPNPKKGSPLSTITVQASDLQAHQTASLRLAGQALSSGPTDGLGAVTLQFQIPASATPGPEEVTVETGGLTAECLVDVLSNSKDPSGDTDGDGIPNSQDQDDDSDGCTDGEEVGNAPSLGGSRNPHVFWDFFDVPTPPGFVRNQAISVADISAVVARFGASRPGGPPDKATALAEALAAAPPPPAYHAGYDRTPNGMLSGPPDGAIGVQDISRAVAQFGHSCLAPP
jgi:hypothetical protein